MPLVCAVLVLTGVRFLLPYIRTRQLVAEGALGTVIRTDITTTVVPSGPANEWWWNVSLGKWGQDRLRGTDCRFTGGGLLGALGSHCFDLACYLTSDSITSLHCMLAITQPQRVTRGEHWLVYDHVTDLHAEKTTVTVTADDYMNIQFKTAKNSLGTITGIYRPFGTSSMVITIYGTEGIITCVDGNMSWHKTNGRLVEAVTQPSAPDGEWHVSIFVTWSL